MRRVLPAVVAFLLTVVALVPPALSLPQHPDEAEYAYVSAYYGGKISRADFSPIVGSDELLDPGWAPSSYWALTQPMGPRYIYAVALGLMQSPPPARPRPRAGYRFEDPLFQVPERSLTVLRLTAVLLCALGLALIVWRLGKPALVAVVLFLATPYVRDDLARGWAEGPLLFGFGIAAAAWGTRAFAPTCGLAVLFKLTALPIWILAFHVGYGRSRARHFAGIAIAWLTWTALEVPAWFFGGPLYLGPMLWIRWWEFGLQSANANPEIWGGLFGHYFPTRYLWPLELGVLVVFAFLVSHYCPRLLRSPRWKFSLWTTAGTTELREP